MKDQFSPEGRHALFKKALGILSLFAIVLMWQKKDLISAFQSLPREDLLSLLFTTLLATGLKVLLFSSGFWLFRKLMHAFKKKNRN